MEHVGGEWGWVAICAEFDHVPLPPENRELIARAVTVCGCGDVVAVDLETRTVTPL